MAASGRMLGAAALAAACCLAGPAAAQSVGNACPRENMTRLSVTAGEGVIRCRNGLWEPGTPPQNPMIVMRAKSSVTCNSGTKGLVAVDLANGGKPVVCDGLGNWADLF